ncbi:hypothetical protein [Paenibacillus sp. HW567]|uniref:hypothetical protein n=1 Tax=Paenibacillus sp. HW567 TaxID=1034769 RepID=UPI000378A26F|nr:hypothetical protein [Paenibacillus sp. HW567]
MSKAYTIYHLARADFLERTRRYSFFITAVLAVFAAYLFVPPADSNYVTFYLGSYRGLYNSEWVGGTVAISTTMFLTLIGFFLVKNSIDRDQRTRVGFIIAGTSLKRRHYLFGKALSNFAVLSVIAFLMMFVALFMQLIRGEDMTIHILDLALPFLIVVIPQMAIVAALAVVFESWFLLRGVAGNIIYLALFIATVTISINSGNISTGIISGQMQSDLKQIHPAYNGEFGQGILFLDKPLSLFQWNGVHWSGSIVGMQLLLFAAALVLCLLASLLFGGFAELPTSRKRDKHSRFPQKTAAKKNTASPQSEENEQPKQAAAAVAPTFSAAELTPVAYNFRYITLIKAELGLMLKGVSWLWVVIAAVLNVLCLLLPLNTSFPVLWPLAWIWPLILWSSMGCREVTHGTHFFLATSPRLISRQLPAVWTAGYIVTAAAGGGILIRLLIEGDMLHALYWLLGSLFIPTLALVSGVITHSKKMFEVLYMLLWYIGPFNQAPGINFLGTDSPARSLVQVSSLTWLSLAGCLVLTIVLFVSAFVFRRRLATVH